MENTKAGLVYLRRKLGPFISVIIPFGSERIAPEVTESIPDRSARRQSVTIPSFTNDKKSHVSERLIVSENNDIKLVAAATAAPVTKNDDDDDDTVSYPPPTTKNFLRKIRKTHIRNIVSSPLFFTIVMMIIVANAVIIGVHTNKELERSYPTLFVTFHYIFLVLYISEILLKLYCDFRGFWRSFGNIFDVVIVSVALFGPIFSFIPGSEYVLRLLRMILALRTIRSFTALRGLRLVVQSIIRAVPDTLSLLFLLTIVMFVFAGIGITLFGNNCPNYFGSLGSAWFSLFICLTLDGWTVIRQDLQDCGYDVLGPLYLVLFVIIGSFILGNLVVAVIINNFESSLDEEEGVDTFDQSKDLTSDKTINVSRLLSRSSKGQSPTDTPVIVPTIEKLEKLFFLLSAFENNLRELKKIQKSLHEILHKVKALSEIEEANAMERVSTNTPSGITNSRSSVHASRSFRHSLFDQRGDAVSGLISLSHRHVFEGSNVTSLNSLFTHLQPHASKPVLHD
ncbi:PREDICTED: cation channel sperm-associated protein 4-like [Amphimedon queenslandica]|uniref:Ion transport domain-containing protein n=1 Tax=Amphimedon queenslandica TaxID=400682 RepID=A0A1X7U8D4_AMPQE|nr:PREDICTED: cation channel sperm-associated protein 4-like [Amphimedon queenslandica]|eukprot:XP_019855649.1 PREDICTED: cation channel sperm-associated protein 4-like [Amphimedon queenslandica]